MLRRLEVGHETVRITRAASSLQSISIADEGRTDGGALHVTGVYEVRMSAYEIKPPPLMFRRIKVRDAVDVKFDLVLKS